MKNIIEKIRLLVRVAKLSNYAIQDMLWYHGLQISALYTLMETEPKEKTITMKWRLK